MSLVNNQTLETLLSAVENNNHFYAAQDVIPLLDLTSLNDTDNEEVISSLCVRAQTSHGNVAAVCIYPQFVATAKNILQYSKIKIATVANFPNGNSSVSSVTTTIKNSIADGADEIDVVIPYQDFLIHHDENSLATFVNNCKSVCGNIILKVILETGALNDPELIYSASSAAIRGGADFLKTSTGKININATLQAAAVMLLTIKENGNHCGFKASGGIRTLQQANPYLALAAQICDPEWISPQHFRIGASSLLDDLLKNIS